MGVLGHRDHRGTQKQGRQNQKTIVQGIFVTLWPGNFPGHNVLWVLPKMLKNAYRWVMMGKYECNGVYDHGGEKKQYKKIPEWDSRPCFVMYVREEKKQQVNRDGHVAQRGSGETIEGNRGCTFQGQCV